MASVQEPEVQFAQRLASNEKPIRTKALKKLRKYINVRSQKETDGFTSEELLKLWKGLFYCLWMQDKPLLQEELSNQISSLIHNFQHFSGQILYMETFLQTCKREWTGIDRLRMDKFFQLVRFMFRQAFQLLKRKDWDSSVVQGFLELLAAQIMQSGSEAPSELQFHVLDLYMTELAAVGSAELTAEQNLIFIEPFCKTAAKTKDRILFSAICSSIFSTIIDQAPFAIEDLMKEVNALENSESEQSFEDDDEGNVKEEECKKLSQKGKRMNGGTSKDLEDAFDNLKESETELPNEEEFGPVLQFDYAALADKLFKLASQSSTPSNNRQKLYRIIKVLRDLSEGIFPQDEYPEEVSTDEDDEMFGSRKRIKRVAADTEEHGEGAPLPKKSKGKKKDKSTMSKKKRGLEKDDLDDGEQAKLTAVVRKTKKKKKKEMSNEGETEVLPQSIVPEIEGESKLSQEDDLPPRFDKTDSTDEFHSQSKKKKIGEMVAEGQGFTTAKPEDVSVPLKKKKRKHLAAELHKNVETKITPVISEEPQEETQTPATKKKKGKGKAENNGLSSEVVLEADVLSGACRQTTSMPFHKKAKKNDKRKEVNQENGENPHVSEDVILKKNKKIKQKDCKMNVQGLETPKGDCNEKHMCEETTSAKKKKKKKGSVFTDKTHLHVVECLDGESDWVLASRKISKKKRKIPVTFEYEADELKVAKKMDYDLKTNLENNVGGSLSTPSIMSSQSKSKPASNVTTGFLKFHNVSAPKPLFCKTKRGQITSESKKVTFGLKNNKTAEFRKTDSSLLVSPDGSSRVPFDPKQKPKFGVLKSPPTPFPNRKKSLNTLMSAPKCRPSAADFF